MGVIRSNNDKGNQLHDEETGEFASKDGAGVSSSAPKEEIPTNEPKLKLKAGADLKNFFEKAKDMNTCAEVPLLKSVEDIDMYVDKFFSKKVCSNIDSLWGRNSRVADFLFLPNPNNPYISLNIFICVLGKNRYKDNHARYIDDIEFKRLEKQVYAYEAIYRGIRYVTREERKKF